MLGRRTTMLSLPLLALCMSTDALAQLQVAVDHSVLPSRGQTVIEVTVMPGVAADWVTVEAGPNPAMEGPPFSLIRSEDVVLQRVVVKHSALAPAITLPLTVTLYDEGLEVVRQHKEHLHINKDATGVHVNRGPTLQYWAGRQRSHPTKAVSSPH